jgi:hypothetical protein
VDIDPLRLGLPLGTLADTIVAALAGDEEVARTVARTAGCPTLRDWIEEQRALAMACDEGCAMRACEAALVGIQQSVSDGLTELDEDRDHLAFRGTASLVATGEGLEVDAIEAEELLGGWGASGEQVLASLRAERLAELP